MTNPLVQLIKKYQKGNKPAFHPGPFLPLTCIRDRGLSFNDIDFMMVVEGGGAAISPKTFRKLLLPCMQDIFKSKKVPKIVSFFGSSEKFVEFMLACYPDGIALDKECSIEKARELIPESISLFSRCGEEDMLANETPAAITEKVNRYLEMGFTTVGPPADIYPPARIENIEAFVKALLEYKSIIG
jgi:uroporphyrinogen-III decarboxylase